MSREIKEEREDDLLFFFFRQKYIHFNEAILLKGV